MNDNDKDPLGALSSRRLKDYTAAIARTVNATSGHSLEQQSLSLQNTMLDHLTRNVICLLDTFERKTFPGVMVLPVTEYDEETLQELLEQLGKYMADQRAGYAESPLPANPLPSNSQPLRRIKCIEGDNALELSCGHIIWPPKTEDPWQVGDLIHCPACLPVREAAARG